MNVMRKSSLLKNTKIRISHDYDKATLLKRKQLLRIRYQWRQREEDAIIKLRSNGLIINGHFHSYRELITTFPPSIQETDNEDSQDRKRKRNDVRPEPEAPRSRSDSNSSLISDFFRPRLASNSSNKHKETTGIKSKEPNTTKKNIPTTNTNFKHSSYRTMQTGNPLGILFWNSHGYNNIFNLSPNELNIAQQCGVIGLTETWQSSSLKSIPTFLSNYSLKESVASKDPDIKRGRAKGGIAVFITRITISP